MAKWTARAEGQGPDRDIEKRNERIWTLHVIGHSSRDIAAMVGLSKSGVLKIIHERPASEAADWSTDQIRAMEMERRRMLLVALAPSIEAGEIPAIGEARKISESICKMYGADGPVTVNHNHADVSAIDAAYLDLVAEMDAANAAREAALRGIRGV
jgi:hypothetical protein